MEPDLRDEIIDFIAYWVPLVSVTLTTVLRAIGLPTSKYYSWRRRYGQPNQHNGQVPRWFWLEEWEVEAILAFHREHPEEGYRRLTYMMLDRDIVAVSPSTTYNVLKRAGLMGRRWSSKTSKGKGFGQPSKPHAHWHVDITYLNIAGTFYYMCSVLDGYSRKLLHWEIRESMKARDVEIVLQRAREKVPGAKPRVISDNGPQFIARDFKDFIRLSGMTHVRTSPFYPQSNGKLERLHGTLKRECIRPKTPISREDAERVVGAWVSHYNHHRLHAGIGYVTPQAKIEGRAPAIHAKRDERLRQARERRRARVKHSEAA